MAIRLFLILADTIRDQPYTASTLSWNYDSASIQKETFGVTGTDEIYYGTDD